MNTAALVLGLLTLALLSLYYVTLMDPTPLMADFPPGSPPLRVAVIYWGLPRSLRYVLPNHQEKIFAPMQKRGISYKTFFHTYRAREDFSSSWEGGDVARSGDESLLQADVQLVDDREAALRQIESMDLIPSKDPFASFDPGTPYRTFRNMCLALRSKKLAWQEASREVFDVYLFLRPDVRFRHSLDPRALLRASRRPKEVLVPHFDWVGDWLGNDGVNDRMAVCHPLAAKAYVSAFDDLIDKRIFTSEVRVLDALRQRRVRPVPFKLFFWRVRGNGSTCHYDVYAGMSPLNM